MNKSAPGRETLEKRTFIAESTGEYENTARRKSIKTNTPEHRAERYVDRIRPLLAWPPHPLRVGGASKR